MIIASDILRENKCTKLLQSIHMRPQTSVELTAKKRALCSFQIGIFPLLHFPFSNPLSGRPNDLPYNWRPVGFCVKTM